MYVGECKSERSVCIRIRGEYKCKSESVQLSVSRSKCCVVQCKGSRE